MCALVGDELGVGPSLVLVCQTGLIGVPLPMAPVEAGVSALVSARATGLEHAKRAATAIMTTDTMCKEVVIEGTGFLVGGMAKGAAMLSPHMTLPDVPHATMLAVLTTDARCGPSELAESLAGAVDATFNRMTLDGCMSTNDTVLVMANGRSGIVPESGELERTLREACAALAGMMAQDAEGGTKVARIVVNGAASESDAHLAARKVAQSQLVKCSLNGEDPYWGRVLSELGSAGVSFEAGRVEVAYGGIVVCRGGRGAAHDTESVRAHMRQHSLEISCDLGMGHSSATVLTCDLGHGYIDENRSTS
jgi:glutamate N-acetyltransferase/amino-acid N-acetyltransferase